MLVRDILEAVDSSDHDAVGIAERSHIDASHPTLSVRVPDHRLYILEALAGEHRTSHWRLVGRYEVPLQTFNTEGTAETLRLVTKPRGVAPKLDSAPVDPDNLAVNIAGVNADRQGIEEGLIQLKHILDDRRRPDRCLEI